MIISTLVAASVATQAAQAPAPMAAPAPAAERKMACCEKMAKGDGCDCCKGMGKEQRGEHGMQGKVGSTAEHQH